MSFITNFFVFVLISVNIFAASGKIKGKVTDKKTGELLIGANVVLQKTGLGAATDMEGLYAIINIPAGTYTIKASYVGYEPVSIPDVKIKGNVVLTFDFELNAEFCLQECLVISQRPLIEKSQTSCTRVISSDAISNLPVRGINNVISLQAELSIRRGRSAEEEIQLQIGGYTACFGQKDFNTEEYSKIDENEFKDVFKNPLSTFSTDVDYASYSNSRRFLMDGTLPPKDAVRVEEFINYFQYDYPKPNGEHPVNIYTEISECPWEKDHKLLHIGIKGKDLQVKEQKPSNLVFLIDVSGSMSDNNKLPLLVKAFKMFTEQLRDDDIVSIVVYAGSSGLVLPATKGSEKIKIIDVLDKLQAGGSTAGGEGMKLAYQIAEDNLLKDGNNRVIWATDGDFNVGVSNTADLVRFLEEKRNKGIFLTVLGFGTQNIKDNRLEQMADKGNGHYAYIDNLLEAKKVLVDEIGSTLFTIAKDVKIQVEFNPVFVKEYRLVGYENRVLANEDFENDLKDAGEIGAGHSVTALYEIIPNEDYEDVIKSELRYLNISVKQTESLSIEIGNIKVRYKLPDEDKSNLITKVVTNETIQSEKTSDNFKFAAAVAMFGMLLRDSKFKGDSETEMISNLAAKSLGNDKTGYRAEFIKLVDLSANLHTYAGTIGQ
jgi:Ca-activated chloride channel family protein